MAATTPAVEFHRFLAIGNIICHSRAASSEALIYEMAGLLARNNAGLDPAQVEKEVLERERLLPTVIAPGLAMPHARFDSLDRPLVALATHSAGVDFRAPGMPPVRVAVLVLSPASNPGLHLQVMSALAREFKEPGHIGELAGLERPSEVLGFFSDQPFALPDFLTVGDIMTAEVPTLLEQDTLHCAIRRFAATRADQMAVLDDDGDLRGVVALPDILQYSLPDHVLWMEDLSPIYHFQPFADMLADANETRIADLMRDDFVRVGEDVPAVQAAKLFLTHRVQELVVVDAAGRLAGVVAMRDFCAKLFWE